MNKCWFARCVRFLVQAWFLWMVCIPLAFLFWVSVSSHSEAHLWQLPLSLSAYKQLFDPLLWHVLWQSLCMALMTTSLCLLLAYPAALALARLSKAWQPIALALLMIPFWTSSLVRTYALMTLLKAQGVVNTILLALGWIHQPLALLYNQAAVLMGLTYTLLPFMVLPIYSVLQSFDQQLLEAGSDLGASDRQLFWKIIWPMSLPGVRSGILLVFFPAMTLFYIPMMLGGARNLLLGNLIEQRFLQWHDWPGGAALSVLLMLVFVVIVICLNRQHQTKQRG